MSQAGTISGGGGSIPSTVVEKLTANDGSVATAVANNINVLGNNTANNGFATWTNNAGSGVFNINSYGTSTWVVNPIAGVGTHQTIQAAITASSPGDTIFITPGTYTENLTLDRNLTFVAYAALFRDDNLPVNIVGNGTISTASVTARFEGIAFQDNGSPIWSITGTSTSVTYENCFFKCNGANIFLCNANLSNVYIDNCSGVFLSTYTIGIFTLGLLWIDNSFFIDVTTPIATTCAGNSIRISNCEINIPFSTSANGSLQVINSQFGPFFTPYINQTWINTGGNGISTIINCEFYSGSASALSLNASAVDVIVDCTINSSNTNAISGTGSVSFAGLKFTGASNLISTSTQSPLIQSNDAVAVVRPGSYPYTVLPQDTIISVDTSSAANTVNLPASPSQGEKHTVKDRSANAALFNITVSGNGHNIVGTTSAASQVISLNGASVTYVYDTSVWLAI
jgi:hypothetical protein